MVNKMIIYVIKNPSKKDYKQFLIKKYMKEISYNNAYSIITNEYGKPYIKDNPFYFNISHSGDYYIMAFSQNEIGIDIQKHSKIKKTIINKFHPNEKGISTLQQFYDLWCKKEAYAKYLGTSIFYTIGLDLLNTKPCLFKEINIADKYSCFIAYNIQENIKLEEIT